MPSHTIRVKAESKNTHNILDENTEKPLFWWRGNDIRIEFSLTDNDSFLLSSDIGVISLVIKDASATSDDDVLMSKTLGATDCNPNFTSSTWDQGENLCVAEFTRAESALDSAEYILIISHDDADGNRNTYLHTRVLVKEDQHESVSLTSPPTPDAEYYTKDEADALNDSAVVNLATNNEAIAELQAEVAVNLATNNEAIAELQAEVVTINDVPSFDTSNIFFVPAGCYFPTSGNVMQDIATAPNGDTFITQDVEVDNNDDVMLTIFEQGGRMKFEYLHSNLGHGEGLFFAPHQGVTRLFLADSSNQSLLHVFSDDYQTIDFTITYDFGAPVNTGWSKSNYDKKSGIFISRYEDVNDVSHVAVWDWDELMLDNALAPSKIIALTDSYEDNNSLQAIGTDGTYIFSLIGDTLITDGDSFTKIVIYSMETGNELMDIDIDIDMDNLALTSGTKYEPEGMEIIRDGDCVAIKFGIMMGSSGDNRHYIYEMKNKLTMINSSFSLVYDSANSTFSPIFDSSKPIESHETHLAMSHLDMTSISGGDGVTIHTRSTSGALNATGDSNLTSHGITAAQGMSSSTATKKEIRLYDTTQISPTNSTNLVKIAANDTQIGNSNRLLGSLNVLR